jgi:cytochrome oxidase assembly protein ShyY1
VDQPTIPLDRLLDELDVSGGGAPDVEAVQWRPVTIEGTWLAEQIVWFNRSQDGLAGDNVLGAMTTPGGTTVVVNRGFVSLGEEIPPAASGDVEVLARVRAPHVRQTGELTDAVDGEVTEVRRVDLDQLATQLPGDVAPVYVDLIAADPALTEADPTPVPMPELDEGPHLSYAMQWFIFGVCVAIGWVLAVRRSIGVRRAASSSTASSATSSPTPDATSTVAADDRGDDVHRSRAVEPAPLDVDVVSGAPAPPSGGTARSRSASRASDRASGTPSPR